MSDVKQTIQVTNAGLSPILSIAQGTGMVDFEFTVSDFQIPIGSTAVAHNIQPTGNIVSQVCTLVGNVITVTPPAYYFLRGKNYMQIQLIGADGVNLFTFLIEVWCSPNISAPVVSQNPDLISQLMAMIGNTQDLDTTAKNNLVAAINEIYARGVVDIVDILDTEEEIEANTDAGKATGALVTKQLISELKFPDGTKFYPDIQDGEYGFNTTADRGADTFHPFSIDPFKYLTFWYNDITINASQTAKQSFFSISKDRLVSVSFSCPNLSDTIENNSPGHLNSGCAFIASVTDRSLIGVNGSWFIQPNRDTGTIKTKIVIYRKGEYTFDDFSDCYDIIIIGIGTAGYAFPYLEGISFKIK